MTSQERKRHESYPECVREKLVRRRRELGLLGRVAANVSRWLTDLKYGVGPALNTSVGRFVRNRVLGGRATNGWETSRQELATKMLADLEKAGIPRTLCSYDLHMGRIASKS